MAVCSFCKKPISQGTGMMFVKNDGKILYFTDKKCEKNFIKLGRDPRKFKWARGAKKE